MTGRVLAFTEGGLTNRVSALTVVTGVTGFGEPRTPATLVVVVDHVSGFARADVVVTRAVVVLAVGGAPAGLRETRLRSTDVPSDLLQTLTAHTASLAAADRVGSEAAAVRVTATRRAEHRTTRQSSRSRQHAVQTAGDAGEHDVVLALVDKGGQQRLQLLQPLQQGDVVSSFIIPCVRSGCCCIGGVSDFLGHSLLNTGKASIRL